MRILSLPLASDRRHLRAGILPAVVATVLFLAALPAVPAYASHYAASLVSISETAVTLKPGETRQVQVTFKNAGVATWRSGGANYVSLYTWDPKYHASPLVAADWRSSSQTGKLPADVAPGKTGTATFTVKAPAAPGIYNEHFQLAAEDLAWITGGAFGITVTVSAGTAPAPTPSPVGDLSALRLLMSAQQLTLAGGQRAELTVLYKNSGTRTWSVRRLVHDGGVRIADTAAPSFYDSSWPTSTVALSVAEEVLPGRTAYVRFALRAPVTKGSYTARFKLTVDDQDVPGGEFDLPVTVTDDAPTSVNPLPGPGPTPTPVPVPLMPEPTIRVGAATVPVKSLVFSSTSQLSVRDAAGTELGTVAPGLAVSVAIGAGGAFTVTGASPSPITASGLVRFVPAAGDAAATQVNAGGAETWSSWANNARFRGTLEVRYYAPADVTWVINELPIEKYLYGLAEMSNGAPHEYHKALITAARSYAYWHLTHPGKHITFTVDATYDQVYRAFNRELQQPSIVQAVEETRGQIVYYDGQNVVTPYYANSDGRTRAWTEVWGGTTKPWLVSVPAPYDRGKTLWGHGVGMSARDAAYHADDEGWSWDRIVTYYYTGVELRKLW